MTTKPARTRVAPSPTGRMHLGTARTALYDYLLARKTGGQFILRIEDTDVRRTVPGTEQEILDGLHWLGLDYDEGPDVGGPNAPYRQTERRALYNEYAWKLVDLGAAFPCFCSADRLERVRQEQQKNKQNPRYDGTCRALEPEAARKRVEAGESYVIRFKMPKEGSITVADLLRGPITTENSALDDSVLLRSDGLPTYHLAAMLDDHLMKITHVVRGSEWLPSLPLHAHIIRAFGWDEPIFVHLSVFLKPSGKGKMSKRDAADAVKDGHSIFVGDLQELGYIPEGVLNWIALMGWGVPEDEEMTLDQMVDRFSIEHLTSSPAAIDFAKLDHFNGAHIRRLPVEELAPRLKPYFARAGLSVDDKLLIQITPLIRERLVTLDDCVAFAGFFFQETVHPAPEDLVSKGMSAAQAAEAARQALQILRDMPALSASSAEPPLRAFVEGSGFSANQIFGILRVATTGQKVSPPLFETMEILGLERVVKRLEAAIGLLEKR